MSLAGFQRYERPACTRCQGFLPEVHVPVGDGTRAMCWLCAHAVTTHEASPDTCEEGATTCSCTAAEIYPADIIARRAATAPHLSPPKRLDVRDVVTHVTPQYLANGQVDHTAPRLSMTLERTATGDLAVKSVEIVPRRRSQRV